MSGNDSERGAATEAALVAQARLGDLDAFAALATRHREAITVLARLLGPGPRVDDLVTDVLEIAHTTMRRMLGPTQAVRPYLLLLTRHEHEERTHPESGDRERYPRSLVPFRDEPGSSEHMPVAHEAYVLPEAWQVALWHREVEGDDETTVGALLGVTPVMAGSLVETARSTLRQGLVTRHREHTLPTSCVAHALRLERNAGRPVPRSVQRHAESCTRCAVLLADLEVVEKDLAGVLAAHLLGPAADGYLQVRRTGSFARDRA